MEHSFLVHDEDDDVGVAVVDVPGSHEVVAVYMHDGRRLTLTSTADIPLGHKIALRDLEAGANVTKYGVVIGCATQKVSAGDYIHTHNLKTARW